MSGICTSSRMTAKSCAMTHRSAAWPESASTIDTPSGNRTAFSASRLEALSSTISTDTDDRSSTLAAAGGCGEKLSRAALMVALQLTLHGGFRSWDFSEQAGIRNPERRLNLVGEN